MFIRTFWFTEFIPIGIIADIWSHLVIERFAGIPSVLHKSLLGKQIPKGLTALPATPNGPTP